MSVRKKIWLAFVGIMILAILAGLIDWPRLPWPGFEWFTKKKVHLGLDLQGGTHLLYECDLSKIKPENYKEAVAGVRDVIERRVNALGLAEPLVQSVETGGHYRLIIELPGVKDVAQAIAQIGQTPTLDFRELIEIPQETKENEQAATQTMFVPTKLAGHHLKRAKLQFDQQTGQPQIGLEFNDEGTKLFSEITERNVGKPVAIFLDNYLISAPKVLEPIREGKAVITGQFTLKEAKDLAMRLNAGALPVPINLISQQNVGASLGKISVEKSFIAFILGVCCVALFMILYYRFLGLVSVFALFIYGLIVLALYKLIPVTLTLSGVAGFIISFGIAVDANVLIFEGLKEGLRQKKPQSLAIDQGFRYAWGAIRDSNITTLITCAILAWFGTSMVKGFAITLGLGVIVSMFSAITVTRVFLKLSHAQHYSKA